MIKISSILENGIKDAIDKYFLFFLRKENVIGVALGYKVVNGIKTTEPSLHVFVRKKLSLDNLNKSSIVPSNFLGLKTDVIEINDFKTYNTSSNKDIFLPSLKSKARLIRAGYSISPSNLDAAGTLGAIVFGNDDNKPYILSNNHVLSYYDKFKKGTKILQPGVEDGGKHSSNSIGKLYKTVKLDAIPSYFLDKIDEEDFPANYVDCAIAKIDSKIKYDTSIENIGEINGITNPTLNMKIQKVGKRSGYTSSVIDSIHATIILDYSLKYSCYFKEQIRAPKFSSPGDSGSLVLDFNNKVIGLIHAGNKNNSFICPIDLVLKYLNIDF